MELVEPVVTQEHLAQEVPQVSADSVAAPEALVLAAMAATAVMVVLVGPRHRQESLVASAVRAVRAVQLRQAKQVMAVMAVTVVLDSPAQMRPLVSQHLRQRTVDWPVTVELVAQPLRELRATAVTVVTAVLAAAAVLDLP